MKSIYEQLIELSSLIKQAKGIETTLTISSQDKFLIVFNVYLLSIKQGFSELGLGSDFDPDIVAPSDYGNYLQEKLVFVNSWILSIQDYI